MAAAPLRIVAIADDSAFNRWLWPVVERAVGLEALLRPDWSQPAPAAASRRLRLGTRVVRRARQWYYASRDAQHEADLAARLPVAHPLTAPVVDVPVREMNSDATAARLGDLAPDLVLVCGAPLLRPVIYGRARIATLNLHLGIAPAYRGMHTLLVPWQRGDYAQLGCTLHHIDDGIDRGEAVLRGRPALAPGATLAEVEAGIAALAAREIVTLVEWLARESRRAVPARTSAGPGELIRYHDRSIRADLRARFARRGAVPALPERIERCYLD